MSHSAQYAGKICDELQQGILGSQCDVEAVSYAISHILRENLWRERRVRNGSVVKLDSFRDLITRRPLEGFGQKPELIERIIADDPETLALFREAMLGKEGGDKRSAITGNNVTSDRPPRVTGNSKSYTLSRLKKDRPDLFDRVVKGELTANKAAIEAGFRKRADAFDALRTGWRKATKTQRERFLEWIKSA